jgi:glycogen debranching enzyme
VLVVTRQLE